MPAEYDTGAQVNITILSVPEGDDKPAKYPLIYQVSELVLINKIDAMGIFDFDKELVEERFISRILRRRLSIFPPRQVKASMNGLHG